VQGRIQGGGLGVKTLFGTLFQFARVFKKKIPTHPKISLPYKNISKPLPRKIFGYTPARVVDQVTVTEYLYNSRPQVDFSPSAV